MTNLEDLRHIAEGLQAQGGSYWQLFPKLTERPDLMGWLLHKGQCVYGDTPLVEVRDMINRLGQTDHLLPKDKYPELQCDLFNLVPVCYACNSLKRE